MKFKKWVVVGSGYIAEEWLKALNANQQQNVYLIGRSETCRELAKRQGVEHVIGLNSAKAKEHVANADVCILAVSIEATSAVMQWVADNRNFSTIIVCEKPGFDFQQQLTASVQDEGYNFHNCYVAYNRRYYDAIDKISSCILSENLSGKLIKMRLGISENFDAIDRKKFSKSVADNWVVANTVHVIDMARLILSLFNIDFYETMQGKKIAWDNQNLFRFDNLPKHQLQVEVEAVTDRPGWFIYIEIDGMKIQLKPLERLEIASQNNNAIHFEDTHLKAGYNNMVTSILEDDLCLLDSTSENIRNLIKVREIFGVANQS